MDKTKTTERIWAEDKTISGDPARNGYWEARSAPGWVEYVRADLLADMTRQRDKARTDVFANVTEDQIFTACTAMADAMIERGLATDRFPLWTSNNRKSAVELMRTAILALAEGAKT